MFVVVGTLDVKRFFGIQHPMQITYHIGPCLSALVHMPPRGGALPGGPVDLSLLTTLTGLWA